VARGLVIRFYLSNMSYGGYGGGGSGFGGGGRGGQGYGGGGRGYGGFAAAGRGRGGGGGGRSNNRYDVRKIFVGGVSKRDTDANSFQQFFQSFGEIEDIILMKALDGTDGHRGFGFVTYKEQAVTDEVLSKSGSLQLDGRFIDCKMALPPDLKPPEGVEGNKLFVGSVPKEAFSAEDLKEYFGQWGNVTHSWVSEGKGFGFVTYESQNGAYKALIHGMNVGHSVRDGIQLDAKWPKPKPGVGMGGFGGMGRGYGGGFQPAYGGYQGVGGYQAGGFQGAMGQGRGGFQGAGGGYQAGGGAYQAVGGQLGYQAGVGGGYQGQGRGGNRYQPY